MYLPKEYPVDSCDYQPCSVHGRCIHKTLRDKIVDICECKMHYTGLFCHLTLCDLKPCGDFGVCTLEPKEDNYVCHCNTGYTGKQCMDTISTCDRTNPCGDRGKCSLINGTPKCSCYAWYEGKYCERFRVRIQYKPLSQRMLEEPFWLGLITVAVVLALICLVYCLKKKFAERIEKFFAEEIERSKTQSKNDFKLIDRNLLCIFAAFGIVETGSAPRYSLTSNVGVSVNVTPIHNSPPMTRSRSSIIGRLCKHGIRNNPGHLSDSEVVHHNDDFSDNESSMNKHRRRFPSLTFFSQRSMLSSSLALNNSQEKEETSRILASLVGQGLTKDDNRRMSLDDFFKMSEAKIRQKRLRSQFAERFCDLDGHSPNATDSETSFSFQRTVPSIAEFHVITETSHEEEESIDSGGITIGSLPSILKQESEAETLLSNIQQIQKLSRSHCSVNELDESSGGHSRLVRSLSPRRPPSGFSSSTNSSSTSTDNSPNHQPLPEITITQAIIESVDPEMDNEETLVVGEYEDEENDTIEVKSLKPDILSIPGEGFPVRRLSAPNPAYVSETKEQQSPGSQSYDSPVFKKHSQPLPLRKYSLELNVPKITINAGLHGFGDPEKFESPPQSAKEIKSGQSFQTLTIMHSSCDRTISESNLSTSGYSSLSSPGISRCNSSSPIPDEIGTHLQYPTFTIPEAPDEISMRDLSPEGKNTKQKSTFGNFLTIPVIAYPVNRPSSPKRKTKEEKRSLEKLNQLEEDIEMKVYKGMPKKTMSLNVSTKRDRLIAMRQQYKTIAHDYSPSEKSEAHMSPSKIYMNEHFDRGSKDFSRSFCDRSSPSERNKIQRNPSWPGYLKTTSSDSEETDASCRSFSRLSDIHRKPKRSNPPVTHKQNKKLSRKHKTLSELARYESADRSSSSPRTSSKDLEKYSSSDSLEIS
ncbi:cubilin-like protein [Leptotrombidium deliense]|uniref:Cubilin-like protein n=1 Tax=Leptotrombidium deliense TaxID=299467 RepID=A0A443SJ62_9ACAR|nr:cubilin-like protein [Leptotrombidium deliense]